MNKEGKKRNIFDRFSRFITDATGRPAAFLIAFAIIIVWGICGPIFNFSDTWQLVINTGTTIITFLMVFVIQQSQNRDTIALQLKLNELIAANPHTSNRLIDIEDLTEEELKILKKYYIHLSNLAKEDKDIHTSHSIDEAKLKHEMKAGKSKPENENRRKQ